MPLTLEQFHKFFVAMFEAKKAHPKNLRDLIDVCETDRDKLEAPEWKQYIDNVVICQSLEIINSISN